MAKYYNLLRPADTVLDLNRPADMIYIDPPFCTQRNFRLISENNIGFDDIWKSKEEYLSWLVKVVTKLYSKLKQTGTIYIHNNFEPNALLFSQLPQSIRKNYITTIYWQRSHPHNNIKKNWGNIVDTILMFGKSKSPYFRVQYSPLDSTYQSNSFNNEDHIGQYALAPITGERSRVGYYFEYKGHKPKYGWRKPKDEIARLDRQGLIHFGKNKPYKKVYLNESKGRPIQNIWTDIYPITRTEKDRRSYPTQKPVKLLKRIIRSSCPDNGFVIDPFAGSGPTIKAVLELNSEFKSNISCLCSDINKTCIDMIAKEIKINFSNGDEIWPEK